MSGSRGIVLVGLMAVGKSTVGHEVARQLGRSYWDSDDALRAAGTSAAEIARDRGGDALHQLEAHNLLQALRDEPGRVFGAAAAVVLEPGVAEALRAHWVVWLRATVATEVARLRAHPSDRPFLEGDVEQMVEEMSRVRSPLYAAVADAVVQVDDREPDDIAAEIVAGVPAEMRSA